jgi:microcystin-dependent protein
MSESYASPSPMMSEGAPPPQPTLTMPQLVGIGGQYPQRGAGGPALNFQGMVQPFAGMTAFGALPAQGQLLAVAQSQQLFSIYAANFGGNGITSFALPDLRGRTAVGGQPGNENAQSLAMSYVIAATPGADFAPLGTIALFGGNYAPPGWLVADGSTLPSSANPQLFEVIGTTYGGNGATTFDLPNLFNCAAVGAGKGPGLPSVALGQSVPGTVPGLGLNYLICTRGLYPSPDGNGGFPPSDAFLAQVVAYAGAAAPADWALCDGSLVKIEDNTVLYSLIGNTYGGDGFETFALPDLRGRMLVGS